MRCAALGHSESRIEYQALSRLRPFTTIAWRKMPSKRKPSRSAARRDGAFRLSHFHS